MCMYRKKHSVYRVQYYPWFQASTRALGMYPLQIREITIMWIPGRQIFAAQRIASAKALWWEHG